MSPLRFRPRCDSLSTMKARLQAGIDGPAPTPPGTRFFYHRLSGFGTFYPDETDE